MLNQLAHQLKVVDCKYRSVHLKTALFISTLQNIYKAMIIIVLILTNDHGVIKENSINVKL